MSQDQHDEELDSAGMPADLVAVQADDAMLDALRLGVIAGDDPVVGALIGWRGEVDSEPMHPLLDTDTAQAIILRVRRSPRRRSCMMGLVILGGVITLGVLVFLYALGRIFREW